MGIGHKSIDSNLYITGVVMFTSIVLGVMVAVIVTVIVVCILGGCNPLSATLGVPLVVALGAMYLFVRAMYLFVRAMLSSLRSANTHPILFTTTLVIFWVGASQFF